MNETNTGRYYSIDAEGMESRLRADNARLRTDNAALRAALKPLAAFADEVDRLSHPDDSSCLWRMNACDLRRARDLIKVEK